MENDAVDFVDPLGAQGNSPGSSPCPYQTTVSCSTLNNHPGGLIVGNAVGGGGAAGGGGDMYALILIGDIDSIGPPPGKESFNSCMVRNAKNASIGGAFDALTLQKTNVKDNKVLSFVSGNPVADLYAGVLAGGKEAPTGGLTYVPDLTKKAMGSTLTAGRRTTDLISLNLAGKGGVPKALGSASTGAKSFLGEIGDLFNLGMKLSTRFAIDAGLFNLEAMGCGIAQLSKQ